jgi:drug/metabolite transporter (DMT)-like permease
MNSPTDHYPPMPKVLDYPGLMTAIFAVIFTGILLLIAAKWDPTQGPLTISLLVVLAFIGTVAFCLFFTIPNDEITSAVVGGLVASFGAVIAFWLGKPHPPK